jgi:putative endonuclease
MNNQVFYVYMVRCGDGTFYTGVTNDLHKRLREHNNGIFPSCYTYKRRPVELVYSCHFQYVSEAISWEKHLKRWSRKKKEALVRGDEEALHKLAACKNETHFRNKSLLSSRAETRDGANIEGCMVRLRSP